MAHALFRILLSFGQYINVIHETFTSLVVTQRPLPDQLGRLWGAGRQRVHLVVRQLP